MNRPGFALMSWSLAMSFVAGCDDRSTNTSALTNTDPAKRAQAVQFFVREPKEAERIIPSLVQLLGDNDGLVREKACIALNRIGSSATGPLIVASSHVDDHVRAGAIRALGHPSPWYERNRTREDDEKAFAVIVEALKDRNAEVRARACEAMLDVSIGSERCAEGFDLLLLSLTDESNRVRYDAMHSIGWLAHGRGGDLDLQKAIEPIKKTMLEQSTHLRAGAVWALGKIALEETAAIPPLVAALKDDYQPVRVDVTESLARLDPEKKKGVVPLLVKAYEENRSSNYRSDILFALVRVGPLPRSLVPLLVSALEDDSDSVRSYARMGLAHIGADALEAAPVLHKILDTSSGRDRIGAAGALLSIENKPEEIIPIAIPELDNPDPETRNAAVAILLKIGPLAKGAVPKLKTLAENDPDKHVRIDATSAVRLIEHPESK